MSHLVGQDLHTRRFVPSEHLFKMNNTILLLLGSNNFKHKQQVSKKCCPLNKSKKRLCGTIRWAALRPCAGPTEALEKTVSQVHLNERLGHVGLGALDVEQHVEAVEEPRLNRVVGARHRLQQLEALLEDAPDPTVLLLQDRETSSE